MQLVILAAGMGSRFGGLKQMEPMDDYGNFILDYSVHDAIRAGFDSVIFIIKREHLEILESIFGFNKWFNTSTDCFSKDF